MVSSFNVDEVLLIDKPSGPTSAQVVARVKRICGAKKAGHAGTLDPRATGLLIIGLNEATKKLTSYLKLNKTYEADILLGIKTDTGDLEGKVIEKIEDVHVDHVKVLNSLQKMKGEVSLPVPMYSAIKRNGKPLYVLARRGVVVDPPTRKMQVLDAELIEVKGTIVRALFDVGSGTYIRSLAEELGRRLNCPATLAGLQRITIGNFHIDDALTLEELEKRETAPR